MNKYFEYTRPTPLLTTEIQNKEIESYCEENGITQLTAFHEISFSSRKALVNLFKHITKASTILVSDISILWNDIESQTLITSMLKYLNAELLIINDPEYYLNDDTSTDSGALDLINTFHQQTVARRLSEGRKAKAKRGRKSSGTPPIGYKWDSDGQIIVDLEFYDTVTTIFEKYFELQSLGKLVIFLAEAGISSRSGTPFTKGSLQVILKNDFYIGSIRHGNIRKRGHHPILINRTLFEGVQEILFNNLRNKGY